MIFSTLATFFIISFHNTIISSKFQRILNTFHSNYVFFCRFPFTVDFIEVEDGAACKLALCSRLLELDCWYLNRFWSRRERLSTPSWEVKLVKKQLFTLLIKSVISIIIFQNVRTVMLKQKMSLSRRIIHFELTLSVVKTK